MATRGSKKLGGQLSGKAVGKTPPVARRAHRVVQSEQDAEVERVGRLYVDAKARAKKAGEEAEEYSRELLELMDAKGKTHLDLPFAKFTRTQTETVITDPDRLKKAIGATLWNKITTKVLDKKKLDAFVQSGEIDTVTLASVSEVRQNKPYITLTLKKG